MSLVQLQSLLLQEINIPRLLPLLTTRRGGGCLGVDFLQEENLNQNSGSACDILLWEIKWDISPFAWSFSYFQKYTKTSFCFFDDTTAVSWKMDVQVFSCLQSTQGHRRLNKITTLSKTLVFLHILPLYFICLALQLIFLFCLLDTLACGWDKRGS